jgi:hypothetical protein
MLEQIPVACREEVKTLPSGISRYCGGGEILKYFRYIFDVPVGN